MWWIYLQTSRNKSQRGFCLQKNKNKQELKNYRPISLLPVSGKTLERLLCDSMFKFFTENSLILEIQSGSKPGESCTTQLLSLTHQIHRFFNDGHEVRSAFLDMCKTFDKDLIFKLKQNGVSGNLLSTLADFLKPVFMVQYLNIRTAKVCAWPIVIFDLYKRFFGRSHNKCQALCRQFATFFVADNINLSAINLNSDLSKINAWANQRKMTFNPEPIKQAQKMP